MASELSRVKCKLLLPELQFIVNKFNKETAKFNKKTASQQENCRHKDHFSNFSPAHVNSSAPPQRHFIYVMYLPLYNALYGRFLENQRKANSPVVKINHKEIPSFEADK